MATPSESDGLIPAATLVILRELRSGAPELLMVERARTLAFAGGALVFPGGRVDPDDVHAATLMPEAPEDAPARLAAIRETVEEAGLALGLHPPPSQSAIEQWRKRLAQGERFSEVLAETATSVTWSTLEPFARWQPPAGPIRRFDTRFYLTRLPDHAAEAIVDGTENVRLFWATAAAVLAEADAGRAALIYPTRRNLERLACFASVQQAMEDARAHPIRTIIPFAEHRDGVEQLCIPDDLGYPITAEPMERAMRG